MIARGIPGDGSQASTLLSDLEREDRLDTDRRRKKRKSLWELQEQRQLPIAIAALLKMSLEIHVPFKICCNFATIFIVAEHHHRLV